MIWLFVLSLPNHAFFFEIGEANKVILDLQLGCVSPARCQAVKDISVCLPAQDHNYFQNWYNLHVQCFWNARRWEDIHHMWPTGKKVTGVLKSSVMPGGTLASLYLPSRKGSRVSQARGTSPGLAATPCFWLTITPAGCQGNLPELRKKGSSVKKEGLI